MLLDDVLSIRIVIGRFDRSFWTFMILGIHQTFHCSSSNVPLFLIKRSIFKDQTFDNCVKHSMVARNSKLDVFKTKNTHIPRLARDYVLSMLSGYFIVNEGLQNV